MPRRTIVSALFVAGLFAVAALGQPPSGAPPRAGDPPGTNSGTAKRADDNKKTDSTDTAVAAALANDPDVKVARAKVQLAEAELAKSKQGVVLKVMTLRAAIDENKRAVAVAEERYRWADQMVQKGALENAKLLEERGKLATAQAALAKGEMELKLVTGGGGNRRCAAGAARCLRTQHDLRPCVVGDFRAGATTRRHGCSPQSLSATRSKARSPSASAQALDKPVKLGAKGDRVKLEQALEFIKKEAGLDVPVRGPIHQVGPITTDGEELTVGAWFQLFEDNAYLPISDVDPKATFGSRLHKGRFYVREYGILLSTINLAPSDAPTLTEFWKQKPAVAKEPNDKESMLAFLRYKRTEMSTKYKPEHPEMIALNKQIEQLEIELKERGNQPKK